MLLIRAAYLSLLARMATPRGAATEQSSPILIARYQVSYPSRSRSKAVLEHYPYSACFAALPKFISAMGVLEELDVTPDPSFSTIQTSSEITDAIIISILAVFIISNILSVVSKLIFCSHEKAFEYSSWVRAFIYVNSDDPIRILSWLSHKYLFAEQGCNRYRNELQLRRLVLPLLARLFILIVAIVSIAISIPTEKHLSGCERGDFEITIDPGVSTALPKSSRFCVDIPMKTDLGETRSIASYCTCESEFQLEEIVELEGAAVIGSLRNASGRMFTMLYSMKRGARQSFYIQWTEDRKKAIDSNELLLFSDMKTMSTLTHLQVMAKAIRSDTEQECTEQFRGDITEYDDGSVFQGLVLDCEFDPVDIIANVQSHVASALKIDKLPRGKRVNRVEMNITDQSVRRTSICPIDVVVTRPLANILPLVLILVMWGLINIIVSVFTSRRGNAFDAGFHIIKEALGHDTTSNPLEENENRNEAMELPLRRWRCGAGGAHKGFIGREGDIPVRGFDSLTNVSGCTQVITEIEHAARLPVLSDVMASGYSMSGSDLRPGEGLPREESSVTRSLERRGSLTTEMGNGRPSHREYQQREHVVPTFSLPPPIDHSKQHESGAGK